MYPVQDCTGIKGLCNEMCPKKEIIFREREKLLHPFEVKLGTENNKYPEADPLKVIKSYTRSAAGKDLLDAETLRPPEVLLRTINYLFTEIISNEEYPWIIVYDFINDRLKAIRQDVVVQDLSKASSIAIMQPIIRFYAYSAYRLCEEPLNRFDHKLNDSNLQECLKRLLFWYDECDILDDICDQTGEDFSDALYSTYRPEVEALYVVFNLGNNLALNRALNLPNKWKCSLVRKVVIISLCVSKRNWVRACRNIKKLPPLLLCLAVLKLSELRKNSLQAISTAYFCKNAVYPLNSLQEQLLYSDMSDMIADCKFYNIKYDSFNILLNSKSFNNLSAIQPKREKIADDILSNCDISDLILNGSFVNEIH